MNLGGLLHQLNAVPSHNDRAVRPGELYDLTTVYKVVCSGDVSRGLLGSDDVREMGRG